MSEIKDMSKKYNLHSWSAQNKVNPMVITKAEGVYFWDEDGKKYFDMSSQLVNSNLGHGNKTVRDPGDDHRARVLSCRRVRQPDPRGLNREVPVMSDCIMVNASGLSCPQPVIETKKALAGLNSGRVEVLMDTATSHDNVARFTENKS